MSVFLLDNLFWVILASLSLVGLVWTYKRDGLQALSAQAAIIQVSRDNGAYLDLRSAAEYTAGHIPLAHHLPADKIEEKSKSFEKWQKKTVVVVCQTGGAISKKAVKTLQDKGFEKVFWLAGGMSMWTGENLPLSTKPNKKGQK